MAIMLADIGADEFLKVYLNDTRPVGGNDLYIGLFTNNVTPTDTDVLTAYTEAAGGGYARKTLTCGSWTITVSADPSEATYAQLTWTFTGYLTGQAIIYGYFIVDADDTLILSERFDSSFTPANVNEKLYITPKIQMSAGTPETTWIPE